jgi:hypothetical protein
MERPRHNLDPYVRIQRMTLKANSQGKCGWSFASAMAGIEMTRPLISFRSICSSTRPATSKEKRSGVDAGRPVA